MQNTKCFIAIILIAATLVALFSSCAADDHVCAFDVTEIVNAASCSEEGELARICSVCRKSEIIPLAPNGHILGDWKDNGAGEYTKTCTLCSETVASFEKYGTASKGLEYERGRRDPDFTLVGIGSCEDSLIVIPRELNGTPITKIGAGAFKECKTAEIIIIPDTVTEIGYAAFAASHIKRIYIPDSVTKIGDSAFADCKWLTELILPNSLTYVGANFIKSTWALSEIIIPQSLTTITRGSFSNSNIRAISLSVGTTKIEQYAFKDCRYLETVALPDTLKEIGNNAFEECESLKNIVLPDSITFIGEEAFSGCSSLTSVNIPKGVATLSAQVFNDCTSLGKVYLHEELKSIHGTSFLGVNIVSAEFLVPNANDYLYKDGSSLIGRDPDAITLGSLLIKSVPDTIIIGSADGSIPTDEKITKIGPCAFQGRSDLTHVVIPKNITSIGGGAFHGCPNIVSIRYEGTVAEWEEVSLGVKWYTGYQVATVKCSDGEAKIEFD